MGYMDDYKARKDAGQTTELSARFTEWKKEGDLIVGRLVSRFPVKAKQGEGTYNHYIFATDSGNVKFFCGSNFDKEIGDGWSVGSVYAVEFLGKEDLGNNRRVNKFAAELVRAAGER